MLTQKQGDNAYMYSKGGVDYKEIFASKVEQALLWPNGVTLVPGFGAVPVGAALGKIASGDRAGYYAPYNPDPNGPDAVTWEGVRSYLVQDSGTDSGGSIDLYVTKDDSYKFAVNDPVVLDSVGGTDVDGTITAIDRSTYTHMAKITCTMTNSVSQTVAAKAHLCIKTAVATPFQSCKGILTQAVETGTGENAKGGWGQMLLSNAILKKGMLQNVDDAAVSDMSSFATADGQYLVIR